MFRKLFVLLICSVLLTSCTASENVINGGILNSRGKEAKRPKCADYGVGDASYTVDISDEKRSVSLEVKRTGGISSATVTSPEELAGTLITDDAEGMRILLADGCELPVSAEVAEGLDAVFAVYLPLPENAAVTDEGAVKFTAGEYTVELNFTEDGYPDTAVLARNGDVRILKFEKSK